MRSFRVPDGVRRPSMGGAKKRMLVLGLGLLVVGGMIATSLIKARQYRDRPDPDLPATGSAMTESIAVPRIDVARLEQLVEDGRARDRVILENDALDVLLTEARKMTPASFEALGTEELEAAGVDKLLADPRAYRGKAFTVRGEIRALRTRQREPGAQEEQLGTLELEDGSTSYFLALEVPDIGGFVRLDGFFLKAFSEEAPGREGDWVDGPFFVARRAIRSFASTGPIEALDPDVLAAVRDDVLITPDGSPPVITGLPFHARWHLLGYARDLAPESVSWDDVPELDAPTVAAIVEDGAAYRGQPFRIPISRLQGVRVRRAGENPIRLDSFTEGWIGNVMWKNVVHFQAPFADRELRLRDYVYGQGFFFKNFAYESSGKGLRVAPVFVLDSLQRFVPTPDPFFATFLRILVATAAVLILLFVGILWRDRRRAKELQQELVRRKRERRDRERKGSVGTAST